MTRLLYLTTAATTALATAVPALAQSAAPGEQPAASRGPAGQTTVYEAAFFTQYAPRTALDIARRVPGFNLDLGNNDIRGFAAAAGNVVINGSRPSSKAESLETTLARIPANQVSRVELGSGDLYGADYAGKSQVLNIIMSANAGGGLDGNFTGSVRRLYTGKLVPDGSISALIRRGASSINLSGGFSNVLNHEEGTDTLTNDVTADPIEFRRKFNSYHDFNPYVSASWALERADNKAIRLNARWSPGQFDLFQRNRVTPADGPPHDDNLIQDYDNPVFELGGDITRPLAGGAIKLVGLATRRKRDYLDDYTQRDGLIEDGAVQNGGFIQTQKAQRNETIGRLSWTHQSLGGFSFEAGGEAALNTLDNTTEFFLIEEDGSQTKIHLPIESARVKETRGEIYVNAGKTLSPALRVDAGLRYEFSHLTETGDALANRRLKFLKPSVTLDWKPGGGWHTLFSVKRTVAQLNFFDFVTTAEISAERINAGNENLQPQRAWEFRATADHPLFGEGLAKLDLGFDLISKLQDRVLVEDPVTHQLFDAPGNLGTGKHAFAKLTLDAPLSRYWNGLRVKFSGTVRRTRVKDPISGVMRNFSDYFPNWEWNVDVRRDIGPLSYGFVLSDYRHFTFFRTDEFDVNFNGGVFGTAFIEYRPGPRTSVTLDLDNALETSGNRRRLRFDPNRADPNAFIINEIRERNRHLNFGLTLKQTFGGASAKPAGN
jgi:hypothetical protein